MSLPSRALALFLAVTAKIRTVQLSTVLSTVSGAMPHALCRYARQFSSAFAGRRPPGTGCSIQPQPVAGGGPGSGAAKPEYCSHICR